MKLMSVMSAAMLALCMTNVAYAQPCPGDFDCDGTVDASDGCPEDYFKTAPGACGCSYGEGSGDADNDGTPNCTDFCWWDPSKSVDGGDCGCGYLDDNDADSYLDCSQDQCDYDPNKSEPGECGCFFPDNHDDPDLDGTDNCTDVCPNDPLRTTTYGVCGCDYPADVDSDSDSLFDCEDPCPTDPLNAC